MIINHSNNGGNNPFFTSTASQQPPYMSTSYNNPFTQHALQSTAQQSVVLCSREDESRYIKEVNERNRVERIKQVREHEKEAARLLLAEAQQKQQRDKERQDEEARYQAYLSKKKEIEELKLLKIIELEKSGKAMRDAQEHEERRLREELEKKEKAIRDEQSKRARGQKALDKERQLQQEKRDLEEAIKQIERKKMVQMQEAQIAHENAQRYREQTNSIMSAGYQGTLMSKMGGTVCAEISQMKSVNQVDYANTRFHTALVVKHPQESAVQDELEKLKKGAFDKAKEEQTKKSIMKAQKENINRINEQRAVERGKAAQEKIAAKRDKELYEREMRKIQIQEGLQKMQNGAKEARENGSAQGESEGTVLQERKEKDRQERMLKMFEQEVIVKQSAPPLRSRSQSKERPKQRQPHNEILTIKVQEEETPQEPIDFQQPYIPLRVHLESTNYNPHLPPTQLMQEMMGYQSQQVPIQSFDDTFKPEQYCQQPMQQTLHHSGEDFNQRAHHQAQQPIDDYGQPESQVGYRVNQQTGSPFFVAAPTGQPYVAPPLSNALPQYFNPYIKQNEEERIQLTLNHPKQQSPLQQSNVDEFLRDNREYLKESAANDSELPEDYGDENSSHSSADEGDETSSMSSINDSDNNNSKINQIIDQAKRQKEELQREMRDYISDSSSSAVGESFDRKYLQKESQLSYSHNTHHPQKPIRSLADEFLGEMAASEEPSSLQSSSILPQSKTSYLKQEQQQNSSALNTTDPRQTNNNVFDYSQITHVMGAQYHPLRHQNANSGIFTGQFELDKTPDETGGELSYSQSGIGGFTNNNDSQINKRVSQGSYQMVGRKQEDQKGGQSSHREQRAVRLEILDENKESLQSQKSLADIFKSRRQQQLSSGEHESEDRPKQPKKEKTKEELAEIRRQMMKRPSKQSGSSQQSLESAPAQHLTSQSSLSNKKMELMSRLAKGEKVEIDKKQMLKLTQKNYEQLPEVKLKKEIQQKKEAQLQRQQQIKQMDKQRKSSQLRK